MKPFLMITLLFLSTLIFAAEKNTVKKSFPAKNIRKIAVKNASGDIEIVGDAKDTIEVVAEKIRFNDNCKIKIEEDGKVLTVELDKPLLSFTGCEVRFHVAASPDTELNLQTGSGDIEVAGIKGAVEFQAGSGNVTIDGTPKKLVGQTGSGDIHVEGEVTTADLKAGSGDINVDYAKAPQAGDLQLVTGSGDIEVQLPPDAKVKTEFKSGSGTLKNEVGDSPQAKFNISARAGSGDLSVKKAAL